MVAGAALGAVAMYLWDPNRGRVRRSHLEQKAGSLARHGGRRVVGAAEDLLHRAHGAAAKARAAMSCEGEVEDAVLADRVRSHIGHVTRHAHAVEVSAEDGVVTLTGSLLPDDHERVLTEVGRVHGVKSVDNHLQTVSLA